MAGSPGGRRAAQLATTRIPIVFATAAGDPVALELVQSVARPGGNITGVTDTELPVLEQLHRDYSARGLMVLALNHREEAGTVRQYARELGLTMPLLLDSTGAIRQSYGVIGLPTSFLIGRDGGAVARAIGPREWASVEACTLIESLLMEPTGRR
jgi:hypothetical protein